MTNDIYVSLKKCHWKNCLNHGVGIIMSFCSNELDWLCIHDDLTTLCAPKFRFDLMNWKQNVYEIGSILQKRQTILVGQIKILYYLLVSIVWVQSSSSLMAFLKTSTEFLYLEGTF